MSKASLRKKYKALRNELTEDLIDSHSIAIANQLLKLPIWEKSFFHLFLSIKEKKEVDTSCLLTILQGKDKEVLVPKSDFESGIMTSFLLTENTLIKKNSYSIPEPVNGIEVPNSKIEVVFIPLLAFDQKGNRVGYGKGFYDKFLNECPINIIKIGLSFFNAEDKIDDILPHDIPLDYCITPHKIHVFR